MTFPDPLSPDSPTPPQSPEEQPLTSEPEISLDSSTNTKPGTPGTTTSTYPTVNPDPSLTMDFDDEDLSREPSARPQQPSGPVSLPQVPEELGKAVIESVLEPDMTPTHEVDRNPVDQSIVDSVDPTITPVAQPDMDQVAHPSTPLAEETTPDPLPPVADPPALALDVLETLQAQKADLETTIQTLESQRSSLEQDIQALQRNLGSLVQTALQELQERKHQLQQSVEQLERRQERLEAEMRQSFAGVSQDLVIRVQSFKEYLVGSLQDLVVTAEDLNLVPPPAPTPTPVVDAPADSKTQPRPQFGDDGFKEQTREIRRMLDQYRTSPDYYGPPWQLRRTFEPIHAERVNNWFFEQGGRGAIRGLGSRQQNVLVASAVISVLNEFYGEQLITLVLANGPESMGEWRRGLQDCLGISRADFGPSQGVSLYEDPEPLVQKADRIVQAGDLPLVIIDEAEEMISLSLLQFPLWLAFAGNPQKRSSSGGDRSGSPTGNRSLW